LKGWTSEAIANVEARWEAQRKPTKPPADAIADGAEDKLHAQILTECRRRGWKAFHGSMAHRTRRTPGEPDFIIAADLGRTLYVEAKTRSTKPTLEQLAVRAHLRKLGHALVIVRSFPEFVQAAENPIATAKPLG
jgi:hypothetical protein